MSDTADDGDEDGVFDAAFGDLGENMPWEIYLHLWWEDHGGTSDLSMCKVYVVESALRRDDTRTAEMHLRDWRDKSRWPTTTVSKFVPGDHYHVLDAKFDRLWEALAYADKRGYRVVLPVKETHVYARDGD